jgi:formylglycine-generating enzyme required for sulfatase activity
MSRPSSPRTGVGPRFAPVGVVLAAWLVAFGGEREGAPPESPRATLAREPREAGSGWATPESAEALAAVDGGASARRRGGCREDMVRVGDFCVDRYEAPNRRGDAPLVMQSAGDAEVWCAAHHKRLCTEDEWIAACSGEQGWSYPYGEAHLDDRCNDDRPWRTVDGAKLAKWPAPEAQGHVRDLYQADPSGARDGCVSPTGVHDLTGNVEEWVIRTRPHANPWPHVLIGCYWSGCYGGGKPTCRSTNNAHGADFRFYETGFRCCRDAAGR